MNTSFSNRLIHETSPYLLQHAHNPVDWYPWGEEALNEAQEKDKPILLSVGYSSCHWCHVMERESFEDGEIARLMNESFVNIKVDREERPDIDSVYMDYVQMTTGSGGWPLTVFLAPDLLPFYGGTYFPPRSMHGRPSFRTVLESVADHFRNHRSEIEKTRVQILSGLASSRIMTDGQGSLNDKIIVDAFYSLLQQLDNRYGGFGNAPKFPSSMVLGFLLRCYRRIGSASALNAVTLTLDHMARGGIYDHLGGGFHRYSVDDRWLVPHFEKMLYDNALLVRTYLEAFQLTGDLRYREVATETLRYVQRVMTDEQGGFYSAEDADSEGTEGEFYVWETGEIESVLGPDESAVFSDYFDVTSSGNWEGKNILNERRDLAAFAESLGLESHKLKGTLDRNRLKLLETREGRVRPACDDKVLASWNGLMLTAFAEAALVLSDESFLKTARTNAEFLVREMISNGRVLRTWKGGEAKVSGYLDDYAHVIEGFLALYQTSGEERWLKEAVELMEVQIAHFMDPEHPCFYFTSCDQEPLLVRQKEMLDNAIPSGNSTTAKNLLVLCELTGNPEYREKAKKMLESVANSLARYPLGFGNWLKALDFYLASPVEIVLIGPGCERSILLSVVGEQFLPHKVIVQSEDEMVADTELVPLLRNRSALGGQATAYVCRNFTCQEPTSESHRLSELLEKS